jgi:hypothetical protein
MIFGGGGARISETALSFLWATRIVAAVPSTSSAEVMTIRKRVHPNQSMSRVPVPIGCGPRALCAIFPTQGVAWGDLPCMSMTVACCGTGASG